MGIFIKNPETERVVRELAALRGDTITGTIDQLAKAALEVERGIRARRARKARTIEEMKAATDLFRRQSGLDRLSSEPVTKAEWDALWPTGIAEIDNA